MSNKQPVPKTFQNSRAKEILDICSTLVVDAVGNDKDLLFATMDKKSGQSNLFTKIDDAKSLAMFFACLVESFLENDLPTKHLYEIFNDSYFRAIEEWERKNSKDATS